MDNFYSDIINSNVPKVMGIVNVTPDSFSDGGKFLNLDSALAHSAKLIEQGADIIDIGGESTRPGAQKVSIDEELKRVIPVIENLVAKYSEVIISIDTTKSKVAEKALLAGARIVNDISGGTFDSNMLEVVGQNNAVFVIMHIQGIPENMQDAPHYNNIIDDISDYFSIQIEKAAKFGINKIIVDPGIGFGKTVNDNYFLINQLRKFSKHGFPIMLGLSKKSFLGKSLSLDIDERDNSTIVSETIGVMNGASIIRTHNVKNAIQMKQIMEFIKNELLVNV